MSSRSDRREFLRRLTRGQVHDPSEATVQAIEPGPAPPPDASGSILAPQKGLYKLQLGRRAMACEFQVIFNLGQYADAAEVGLAALDLLEPLEEMMSFFRPKGELGRINAMAADQEVPVSQELWELLVLCRDLWERTDGAFDITAAPLWQVWGFARREGRLPQEEEIRQARELSGWRCVELDTDRRTVRFLKPGAALNLGSIGKGYALDRVARLITERGIQDFTLHGGFSSVWAQGDSWERPSSEEVGSPEGWPIGLRDPLHPNRRLGTVWLKNRGLGTSGTALQFFWYKGRRYGHILDPRSGFPAEGVLSVTVTAPSAAEADALATAFFILGPVEAKKFCEKRPDVGAVFVLPDQAATSRLEIVGTLECLLRLTAGSTANPENTPDT